MNRVGRFTSESSLPVLEPVRHEAHKLDPAARAEFERSLGAPFGDVVVHSGPASSQAVDSVDAAAFTIGRHVVLGSAGSDPTSTRSRMLLGHELAHVVQQRRGGGDPDLGLRAPGSALPESRGAAEGQADAAGVQIGLGEAGGLTGSAPVGVAREDKKEELSWRDKLKAKLRDKAMETLGTVEGVAIEAGQIVDTLAWVESKKTDLIDSAVDWGGKQVGASKETIEVAKSLNNPTFKQIREEARKRGMVDPDTGAPIISGKITELGDAAEAKVNKTLGVKKDDSLFTTRELGQLEGAIGSQVALSFVGVEEVQLALKAVSAVGVFKAILDAMDRNPKGFGSDRNFWVAVANAVLHVVGLKAASSGKKIITLVVDVIGVTLASGNEIAQLATDYAKPPGEERDKALKRDFQALVKVVAGAIQQAISHHKSLKAAGGADVEPAGPVAKPTTEPGTEPLLGTPTPKAASVTVPTQPGVEPPQVAVPAAVKPATKVAKPVTVTPPDATAEPVTAASRAPGAKQAGVDGLTKAAPAAKAVRELEQAQVAAGQPAAQTRAASGGGGSEDSGGPVRTVPPKVTTREGQAVESPGHTQPSSSTPSRSTAPVQAPEAGASAPTSEAGGKASPTKASSAPTSSAPAGTQKEGPGRTASSAKTPAVAKAGGPDVAANAPQRTGKAQKPSPEQAKSAQKAADLRLKSAQGKKALADEALRDARARVRGGEKALVKAQAQLEGAQEARANAPKGSKREANKNITAAKAAVKSAEVELGEARTELPNAHQQTVRAKGNVREAKALARAATKPNKPAPGPSTERGRQGLPLGWDHDKHPRGPSRAWRVGDPVDMPSKSGAYPRWGTIRKRTWRTKAADELAARRAGTSTSGEKFNLIDPIGDLTDAQLAKVAKTGKMPWSAEAEIEHERIPQRVGRWMEAVGVGRNRSRVVTGLGAESNLLPTNRDFHAVSDAIAHEMPGKSGAKRNPTLPASLDERATMPLASANKAELAAIVAELRKPGVDLNTPAGEKLRAALTAEKARRGHDCPWEVP